MTWTRWNLLEPEHLGSHPNISGLSLQYVDGGWVSADRQRTRASFLSSKILDCSVPSLSRAAVNTEDFMIEDRPYTRWEMKVP